MHSAPCSVCVETAAAAALCCDMLACCASCCARDWRRTHPGAGSITSATRFWLMPACASSSSAACVLFVAAKKTVQCSLRDFQYFAGLIFYIPMCSRAAAHRAFSNAHSTVRVEGRRFVLTLVPWLTYVAVAPSLRPLGLLCTHDWCRAHLPFFAYFALCDRIAKVSSFQKPSPKPQGARTAAGQPFTCRDNELRGAKLALISRTDGLQYANAPAPTAPTLRGESQPSMAGRGSTFRFYQLSSRGKVTSRASMQPSSLPSSHPIFFGNSPPCSATRNCEQSTAFSTYAAFPTCCAQTLEEPRRDAIL